MEQTLGPIDLSIVIPAYNEERRLAPTLDATLAYMRDSGRSHEIIVVDDGSTDGTAATVDARVSPHLRLLRLGNNRGKGAAVRAGVLASQGRRVLFMDADGSTAIEEVARLDSACDAGAGIAVGSRGIPGASVQRTWLRSCVTWLFRVVLQALLFDLVEGVIDTQCGFKLFRGDLARDLFARAKVDRFAFDVEILALAKGRTRCAEVPVRWVHRPESKVNVLLDGMAMIRDIWRMRRRVRVLRSIPSRQLSRAR